MKGWIYPKDRLPAIGQKVITRHNDGQVQERVYTGHGSLWNTQIREWLDESPVYRPSEYQISLEGGKVLCKGSESECKAFLKDYKGKEDILYFIPAI
jgi:hypothetical protein